MPTIRYKKINNARPFCIISPLQAYFVVVRSLHLMSARIALHPNSPLFPKNNFAFDNTIQFWEFPISCRPLQLFQHTHLKWDVRSSHPKQI